MRGVIKEFVLRIFFSVVYLTLLFFALMYAIEFYQEKYTWDGFVSVACAAGGLRGLYREWKW